MPATKFKLTLEIDDLYGGLATLSDGTQEATIIASFPDELGTLVGPMHLLLWGASDSRCSWMYDLENTAGSFHARMKRS
ncbi:hypothetical protein [Ktedonobacter robiniae]|uniref:Uncharacterized protein n=1 Tax=Ktedonobacter robiniae TaxID=2778365 RepID=A0ABQ3UY54_9CHLR|nr:hypothetical protein [Ktedonobacter robiniae]GHO57603.1 hypothetical protein KSB_60780 [Ktedonobacter robiniae]